jgi:hypothetical protein
MITRRGSILSVAAASAAAAPEAPSNATAAASASSRQYLISSAVARQLTGVKTMPGNWHAQYRVAISYRFRITTTRWSPALNPMSCKPPATDAMSRYQSA